MPRITATVDCPVYDSFRVQQIAGLFDVPLAERCRESFSVEVPSLDEDWTIGVIVGPSGAGKSTIARAAFGDAVYAGGDWPRDRAVIDGFDRGPLAPREDSVSGNSHVHPANAFHHAERDGHKLSTRDITAMLTAVGFSSPPSWIKPYWALSNGERFRCDLARALLHGNIVVFDEFTSVVDRTVAKVGSTAVASAVRKLNAQRVASNAAKRAALRFVAVTCHYDVVAWLEPDWVLDMATRELRRGRLRRPDIVLEVVQCPQSLWGLFARHHYLSGKLARASTCYAALWHGPGASATKTKQPVAFCATTGMYGRAGRKRITRIVVLPDYQGLGIGLRLVEHVCRHESGRGFRVSITASHPAVIAHCKRSDQWQAVNIKRAAGQSRQTAHGLHVKTAAGRSVVSFEYVGQPLRRAA